MALTAGEQAALDRIDAELTRRDPYLAMALASFAMPATVLPPDAPTEAMRSRFRCVWAFVSVVGALMVLLFAVVGTQMPSGRCLDTKTHPVCADMHHTSPATQGAFPAE